MEGSLPIRVPPEMESGVYANVVGIWHTPHEFTIDFSVLQPIGPAEHGEPGAMAVGATVVARVKIAPTLVFDVLRALNENMTGYEAMFGEIRRPEPTEPEAE